MVIRPWNRSHRLVAQAFHLITHLIAQRFDRIHCSHGGHGSTLPLHYTTASLAR